MSRFIILEEDSSKREVVIDEKECRYKVNSMCFNNYDFKDLGKKCHKKEECKYFEKENKKRKNIENWKEKKK